MAELVKTKSFKKLIDDYILEFSLEIPTGPVDACKKALHSIKEKKKDKFLNDILQDLIKIDASDLLAEKSIERLYKSLQVIAKVTTEEKINRFKKLTINGIIYQNETTENEYELYLNILDSITEYEFIILSILNDFYPTILITGRKDESCGFLDEINYSNYKKIINEFKTKKVQVNILEKELIDILKEATKLKSDEISDYKRLLNSKGLVELDIVFGGDYYKFKSISTIGQKFMEFINREGIE